MSIAIPAKTREKQINSLDGISFIRWDGEYKTSHSRVVVACDKCGHEWTSTPNRLLHAGNGCPRCKSINSSKSLRFAPEDRIRQINENKNITFVRWDGEYRNQNSKAVVRCVHDGFEWSSKVTHLVHSGTGCSKCSKQYVSTRIEKEEQIHKLKNIKFIKWESEYKTNASKAIMECLIDGNVWSASASSLLLQGTGCPACAKHGFNASKSAVLYVLRSECGTMMKVGISNKKQQRFKQLEKRTPFTFTCIELFYGRGSLIAKLEKAIHSITTRADLKISFDGFTEWRVFDPKIHKWLAIINEKSDHLYNIDHKEIAALISV